jgi:pimeloyl-ACP methyl ester carboxylesterase
MHTDVEQHEVTLAGYRIFYQASGSGRPLVLVHGVGGSSVSYQRNIPDLARRFRVYALDIPGHGRSEKPEAGYEAECSVPVLASFIREVCGEPAALVGMSAGGLMSALTAAAYPELVTHLVLVSSAGLGRDIGISMRLLSLPVAAPFVEGMRPSPEGVRLSMRQVLHDPSSLSDEMAALLCEDRSRPGNARAMVQAIRSNVSLFGLKRWRWHRRALGKVAAPVMIIWGRQDRIIPVRHAYRAYRWLGSRLRLHVLDRCGHWPPYERADEFNQLVLDFVGG